MTALIAAADLGTEVWAQLGGGSGQVFTAGVVNLFRGRVHNPPLDPSGVVHAYAVLYETPGRHSGSRIGSTRDRFDGLFQVTCVAGDSSDGALWCADRVKSRLSGQLLTVPGRTRKARIVEDESNAARNVLVDEDVSPPRFYVPLLFNIRA